MELAGQMLLVDCVINFMPVYHLNHLECTMVGEGIKKSEIRVFPGRLEEPSYSIGFSIAPAIHLICSSS